MSDNLKDQPGQLFSDLSDGPDPRSARATSEVEFVIGLPEKQPKATPDEQLRHIAEWLGAVDERLRRVETKVQKIDRKCR